MISGILSSQSPTVIEYGPGASPAPAPPASAPPPSSDPLIPVSEPRPAFQAVALPSLFGIVGTSISSSTLATLTCDEAAPGFVLSQSVPGLTFSMTGKVLYVAGTPATPTDVYNLVVTYTTADGLQTIGASSHAITIVNASEVLTIGAMSAAGGKVGYPAGANLVSLSTNYSLVVTAETDISIPGMTVSLAWTRASSSASGVLSIVGWPTVAGTYTLNVTYTGRGVVLGVSTHTVIVAQSYEAFPSLPSAAPAPSPPSPSPPPAPTPAPGPYYGPDALKSRTPVRMHFNTATGLAYDSAGARMFTNNGATTVTGFAGQGAAFSSAGTYIEGLVPELQISADADEYLTVDVMVKVDSSSGLWSQPADDRYRFMPVVQAYNANETLLWALGFRSYTSYNPFTKVKSLEVCPAFVVTTKDGIQYNVDVQASASALEARANVMSVPPDAFVHLRGQHKFSASGFAKVACWADGLGPDVAFGSRSVAMFRPKPAVSMVRVGGTCMLPGANSIAGASEVIGYNASDARGYIVFEYAEVLPCVAVVDEFRITKALRNSELITNGGAQLTIPPYIINPPWTDY